MTSRHERLAELDARVELGGTTGERHARPVLDAGRHGLEFFRQFGPAYARFTGHKQDFRRDFLRRYEAHADIAFGPLREDGERFATIHSGLGDSAVALRTQGEAVFSSWRGGAADSAADDLAGLLRAAAGLRARFARLRDVVGEAADRADRAVHELAKATAKLYAERVDGHTASDVRFLVDFHGRAARGDDVDDDELARAAHLCRVTARARHALLNDVTARAGAWLHGVFVPAYEAKAEAFDRVCATADEKLAACWRTLDDALRSVVDPDAVPADDPRPTAPAPTRACEAPATPASAASGGAAGGSPGSAGGGPVSGGSVGGGSVGGGSIGSVGGPVGGGPVGGPGGGPAGGSPAPGMVVGAAPVARDAEPVRTTVLQQAAPVARNTPTGLYGGVPHLGGGGGETAQRHTVHLPLAGLDLSDDVVGAGFVIGGQDDPVVYNDAILEENETARRKADRVPTADEMTDDLW